MSKGANIYKVITEARVELCYLVRADSEEEATAKWDELCESGSLSSGELDEDSVHDEEYERTEFCRPYEGSRMQKWDMKAVGVRQLSLTPTPCEGDDQ